MSGNDHFLETALAWLRLRLGGAGSEQLAVSQRAASQAELCDPPPALSTLARLLGLSRFEQQILLLCAAMELDTRTAALCARAQSNPMAPFPTFSLALALFDDPAWDALSPDRPLRYWRLVEIHQAPGSPLNSSPIRIDERIASYIKGLNFLDDRVSAWLLPLEAAPALSAPEWQPAETIAAAGEQPVQLLGPASPAKQAVARRAAARLGLQVLRLPAVPSDIESFARLWERERRLLPLALYIDCDAPAQLLDRIGGLVFLDTREAIARPATIVDIEAPAPWRASAPGARPRLDGLAQRIPPVSGWEDLVLPPEPLDLLHRLASQVRSRAVVYDDWGFGRKLNRGLGITALFAGESGTGKTMAAEVIASDLHLDLYRIDLSTVISKYIGETEKNLRRVFDSVEASGAILFFDEADALFGKRSEVRDSHDRYANIEINYLLQRMESYRGLAILATNMKQALDPAFLRRLRFVIEFPFPGLEERRQMWQKIFPAETPTRDLDLDRLARMNVTGGVIHNIAVGAAFLAAGASSPVTMPLVFDAARAEFRKLERPIDESEFRYDDQAAHR